MLFLHIVWSVRPAAMVKTCRLLVQSCNWTLVLSLKLIIFIKCEKSLAEIKVGLLDINHIDTRGNYLHYSQVLSLHVHEVILRQSVPETCGRGEDIWSQGQLSVPQLRNISRQPLTEIHRHSRSRGKVIQPSSLALVSQILLVSQFISCSHPGLHMHPNAGGVTFWVRVFVILCLRGVKGGPEPSVNSPAIILHLSLSRV